MTTVVVILTTIIILTISVLVVLIESNLSVEKSFQTSLAAGIDHVESHHTVRQIFDMHLRTLHSQNMLGIRKRTDRRGKDKLSERRNKWYNTAIPPITSAASSQVIAWRDDLRDGIRHYKVYVCVYTYK